MWSVEKYFVINYMGIFFFVDFCFFIGSENFMFRFICCVVGIILGWGMLICYFIKDRRIFFFFLRESIECDK